MTKPDMIRKLEQGEELWTTERIFPSKNYLGKSIKIKSSGLRLFTPLIIFRDLFFKFGKYT